ncbi:MAG: nucleotidyltransferase [Candidatus Lokiarchaeota archaeon]|nr:nucleotidyltransferase [Candidatus Lokiarchaeota archaeon]
MSSRVQECKQKNLINPPKFLPDNLMYEVLTGSAAYGVSSNTSDMDICGFCIPPKTDVFPHLAGHIQGLGKQIQRFNQWQMHHIEDSDRCVSYDFCIYGIVRFFQLCMENNPNMVDVLFVPERCILHNTIVGQLVRENRKMFLHKGSYHKFKGYSYSQLHKMSSKKTEPGSKRHEIRNKYGMDTKFAYHVYRLVGEVEQILREGDLTLDREDRREVMKAIRRGEWTEERLSTYFEQKEKHLEDLYHSSDLQYGPSLIIPWANIPFPLATIGRCW